MLIEESKKKKFNNHIPETEHIFLFSSLFCQRFDK